MKHLVLLTFCLCLFACQKVDIQDGGLVVQPTRPSFDFDVPANFDWSVHKVIDVEVIVADQYNGAYNYIVEIYHEDSDEDYSPLFSDEDADGNSTLLNPAETPQLLYKGVVPGKKTYKTKVAVLKDSEIISVVQVDPNGNKALVTVPINGSSVHFDFNSLAGNTTSKSISTKSISTRINSNKEPVVPEGALSIPANGQLLEGKTYVIKKGERLQPGIRLANGVKLYVAGTLQLPFKPGDKPEVEVKDWNHMNENDINSLVTDVQLYVLKGGMLGQNGHLTLGDGVDLYNYGTVTVNGRFTFVSNNIVDNYGTIHCYLLNFDSNTILNNYKNLKVNGGRLTVANNAILNNYGKIETSYGVTIRSGAKFTNHSYVEFKSNQNLSVGGKSELINYGCVKVQGDIEVTDATVIVRPGGYIKTDALNVRTDSKLIMEDDSKLVTNGCFVKGNGKIVSNTNRSSSVIISTAHSWAFPIESSADVVGKICLDNIKDGQFGSNKQKWGPDAISGNPGAKVIVIPATEFNDNGYNTTNDGGIINPEPSVDIEYFQPTYKVAFEDNFPERGDLDMNDLVFTWQIGTQKNIEGKIERAGIRISVMAVGASKQIAAAMKIVGINNVSSAKLTKTHDFSKYFKLSQNSLEAGNTDVVVPLFENAHALFDAPTSQFVNVGQKANLPSYEFDVELTFTAPIESISFENFDFFIVTSGNMNSRTEIHTFGGLTTSKASNKTDFATNNKIIYGINVSSNFKHSMESISIIDSYDEFTDWVTSGGISNPRWFNSPESTVVEPYNE